MSQLPLISVDSKGLVSFARIYCVLHVVTTYVTVYRI